MAVVRGGGAGLYDRPGGAVIGQLTTGTALTVWGRSGDSAWLVVTAGGGVSGWVEKATVVAFDLETLPVVDGGTAATVSPAASVPASGADSAAAPDDATPTPAAMGDEIIATVAVTDSRLNIRTGPGTTYAIVGKAQPGESFVATGRNTQATWIEIATPDLGDGFGWVAAAYVTLNKPVLGLPVSERVGAAAPDGAAAGGAVTVVSARTAATPAAQTGVTAAPAGLAGRLVFQSVSGGQIYVYELDTGVLYPLTGGFDPAISPDGRTVAFTRYGGDQGLYLIDIDGKNERRIYAGSQQLRAPTWSPDGAWIAFVRVQGSYSCRDLGFGICIPNFSLFREILEDFPLDRRPEWSLSRVNTGGQEFRDLPALTSVQAPSWHNDGIVYGAVSSIEITQDVPEFTTRAVFSDPHLQDPDWQPGGDRIVFQIQQGSHWEIYTISPDGSGLQNLTRPVTTLVEELPSNVAPAWSPDGRSIVYLSNRDEKNDAGAWRLWVMGADGSNQRPLPVNVPLDYSYANEQVVSWGVSG
ncbi:MAG: hypothetical protein DCC57_01170 [Chloroflexi bacterium]|nr:MAG: hypothetical protein DCC57_01170 [Chloroflexota bacterium]